MSLSNAARLEVSGIVSAILQDVLMSHTSGVMNEVISVADVKFAVDEVEKMLDNSEQEDEECL